MNPPHRAIDHGKFPTEVPCWRPARWPDSGTMDSEGWVAGMLFCLCLQHALHGRQANAAGHVNKRRRLTPRATSYLREVTTGADSDPAFSHCDGGSGWGQPSALTHKEFRHVVGDPLYRRGIDFFLSMTEGVLRRIQEHMEQIHDGRVFRSAAAPG